MQMSSLMPPAAHDRSPVLIDGSEGEGGGQVLRTALSLSLVTGRPFEISGIRAGRTRPGLQRQHLACVRAATAAGNADAEGAELGSTRLRFKPTGLRPLALTLDVGGAGSTSLVLQTVLPAMLMAEAPGEVTVSGGTHNPLAPPFPFLERSFLPLLRRIGFDAEAHLVCPGFAPNGGGRCRLVVRPGAGRTPLDLARTTSVGAVTGRIFITGIPRRVADEEIARLADRWGWVGSASDVIEHPEALGPGYTVHLISAAHDHEQVFTGFGAPGVRAAVLSRRVSDDLQSFLSSGAAVEEHLADQLLLPMLLGAGGTLLTTAGRSGHLPTNAAVINRFVGPHIRLEPAGGALVLVRVEPLQNIS